MAEKMKYKPCIYAGSENGLLKSIDLGKRTATNYYGPDELKGDQSIQQICNFDEKQILVGMKNGGAKYFDCEKLTFEKPVKMFEPEKDEFECWTGLDVVQDALVGTSQNGIIRTWSKSQFKDKSENSMDENNFLDPASEAKAKAGKKVRCSKIRGKMVALAGDECQLQMFDLEHLDKGSVFTAKSVRPDKLMLHIPVNFPAIALPKNSELIAATSYGSLINQAHELRIYDPRIVQRRPVKRIEWGRHPITSLLCLDGSGDQYIVANARGKLAMIDIRNEKKLRAFKGAAGSIRGLYQHPDQQDKFGAVGLDRHLHVYETKTCSKIHKVYLKSQLNCLLMEPGCLMEKEVEKKVKNDSDSDESEDEEIEKELWNDMDNLETVQDD